MEEERKSGLERRLLIPLFPLATLCLLGDQEPPAGAGCWGSRRYHPEIGWGPMHSCYIQQQIRGFA